MVAQILNTKNIKKNNMTNWHNKITHIRMYPPVLPQFQWEKYEFIEFAFGENRPVENWNGFGEA
jgi:hypothetical protein